jgi:hypothetical protein
MAGDGSRRRAGSPSHPYPCRGVIWRRDRNALNRLPIHRKAGQGPCQNGGSCIELRISFGAVCVFLYIAFDFAPEMCPNSISQSQHCHNTTHTLPASLLHPSQTLKAGFDPQCWHSGTRRPLPLVRSIAVGARLDNKHNSRVIHLRDSRHPTTNNQTLTHFGATAHRPLTPPYLVGCKLRSSVLDLAPQKPNLRLALTAPPLQQNHLLSRMF